MHWTVKENKSQNMAIYAVFLIAVCLSATSAVHKPCGVGQCKLVLVGQNPAVKFQQLASEEGVRLVYFNLEIGNNSVHPLESNERLFAKRWIWAKTIREPMLRMTDDEYDIYSLGLLTRQKRYMSVQLEEKPPKCLAELNTFCQDNVVAEALLGNITKLSFRNRLLQTGSVCTYHKRNSSSPEGWEFLCCSLQNNTEGNHTIIRCGLALGNIWFSRDTFKYVYSSLLLILISYAPAILLLVTDWLFNVQHEREQQVRDNKVSPNEQYIEMIELARTSRQTVIEPTVLVYTDDEASDSSAETDSEFEENSSAHHEKEDQKLSKFEIPVDDDSPITVSALVRDYIEKLPQIQLNFNLKLFFLIFVVLPIFLYLRLAVVFFYNLEYYQEVSRKRRYHCVNDGELITHCLGAFVDFQRQWKLTFLSTTSLISCVSLFLVIPFIKPKDLLPLFPPLGQLIFGQLEKQRHYVFDFTYYMLEIYMFLLKAILTKLSLSGKKGKSRRNSHVKCFRLPFITNSRRRQASRFLCDFLFIVPGFLISATLGIACILFFFIGLCLLIALFSPMSSCALFLVPPIRTSCHLTPGYRRLIGAVLFAAFAVMCFFSLCVILIMSLDFITSIFLLTIMGLVLNYEFATPYVVFISVVAANIYLCYSKLQSRYREVKGMISKHWEEETKDLSWIKCRNDGTIPEELFWCVCTCGSEELFEEPEFEMQILPLRTEICFMLRDMALIILFLGLFFFAVLFFETMEEISALVSTFFVFISGVIPTLIFKRFTKKKQFSGWDKIKIDNKIKEAVREYVLAKMEKIPFPYEVSGPGLIQISC